LFSFGTILYWLSCGKLPYEAPSPAALLRNILDARRQDPRMVRRTVSDALARIIERCLENDPARRYQSAAEVKKDLLSLLADAGIADPEAEVTAFVKTPDEEARSLRARLVARSLAKGEQHLGQGKTSAALSEF